MVCYANIKTDYEIHKRKKCNIEDIINGIIQISDALIVMHEIGISHRDIKPANILIDETNNKWYLGDFGLAKIEEDSLGFTKDNKGLGAIFTIAPEMKRNPKNSDGKKADVFSLAKTLWMLLNGDELGFDGEYNFNDEDLRLRSIDELQNEYLVELEELLIDSTKNNPQNRPTINEFKKKLEEWRIIRKDDDKRQDRQWNFFQRYLFTEYRPKISCWNDLDAIIKVLNLVVNTGVENHMFLPDGGGLHLLFVERATELGCMYLHFFSTILLVKPKNLYFVHFDDNIKWDYLFLELDELEPIITRGTDSYEVLIKDKPGNYISSENESYGVYKYEDGDKDGNKFPEGWKVVRRYFSGNFVISLNDGYYNELNSSYNNEYNFMDFNAFYERIENLKDSSIVIENSTYIRKDVMVRNSNVRDLIKNEKRDINYNDIKNKCNEVCCVHFIKNNNYENEGSFYISIESNYMDSTNFFKNEKLVLCKDGYFRELDEISDNVYLFNDRKTAYDVLNKCRSNIYDFFQCNDESYKNVYFKVYLSKFKTPKHLFTRDEFEKLIINADDRVNTVLVVDENGYINILTGDNMFERNSYPVRLESFDAKNCNVGIYSSIETRNYHYIMLLEGWLEYLKINNEKNELFENLLKYKYVRTVYKDYLINNNLTNNFEVIEKDLIEEISIYYK